jgi:hypothetical protein
MGSGAMSDERSAADRNYQIGDIGDRAVVVQGDENEITVTYNADYTQLQAKIDSLMAVLSDRAGRHTLAIRWISEIVAAVFVDEMRMLYVGTSSIGRRANIARYYEFVDMASQHLDDFNNQFSCYIDDLDVEFISAVRAIERRQTAAFRQLKAGPCSLDDGKELFRKMAITAEDFRKLCSGAGIAGYDATVPIIEQIGARAWETAGRPIGYGFLDQLFRVRLNMQTILLGQFQIGTASRIFTIADDHDQSFALAYFLTDDWLLRNGTPDR